MRYIRELLITILLIGAAWLGYEWLGERAKRIANEDEKTRLRVAFDSVTVLQRQAGLEALRAMTDRELMRQRFDRIEDRNRNLIIENEKLKNRHPARLSDAAIDSAWTAIYPDK